MIIIEAMKNKCLSILCGLMMCGSVGAATLAHLSSETIDETFDTICWRSSYTFQGYDFPLPSCEGYESLTYIDYVLEYRDKVNCKLYRRNLAISPIKHTAVEDTILLGDTLFFCGEPLLDAGVYECTLMTNEGCDSIVQLTLHTQVGEVVVNGVNVPSVCADDAVVTLQLDVTGRVDSLELLFALDSIDKGLHDTIVPMTDDGHIAIAYDNLHAGVYDAHLIGYFRSQNMFEEDITMVVNYPSSVMEKRWDDVICVLTNNYNGGYDFVAYQWYKNGQPLVGETGYYLNQPLDEEAEYSVLLTEVDGTQLMSCPMVVESEEPDISVEPTLVKQRQPVRCYVSDDADVYLYDVLGNMVMHTQVSRGENYLKMPNQHGVYLLKVGIQNNKERTIKIIVN